MHLYYSVYLYFCYYFGYGNLVKLNHLSSNLIYYSHNIGHFFPEKRKEPPDSDTKPSSSVESVVQANSTSGTPGGKSTKRARR